MNAVDHTPNPLVKQLAFRGASTHEIAKWVGFVHIRTVRNHPARLKLLCSDSTLLSAQYFCFLGRKLFVGQNAFLFKRRQTLQFIGRRDVRD